MNNVSDAAAEFIHQDIIDLYEETEDYLPMNTRIIAELGSLSIEGLVVGKSSNGITESYIIKCIDNQLPNDVYKYDTFTAPLNFITTCE